MKIFKYLLYAILFLVIPIIFIIFQDYIAENWNKIESWVALTSYILSIYFIFNTLDMNFYFFIKKVISWFKYDYTEWLISSKFSDIEFEKETINNIASKLITKECKIKSKDNYSLELLWQNKILLNFFIYQEDDIYSLNFKSSKIVVPSKNRKNQIRELTELYEYIHTFIRSNNPIENINEIQIIYKKRSPYYSYWIKKLPEEMIKSFNCEITLPNNNNSKISVNKNIVRIITNQYNTLFNLTNNYITLQQIK